RVLFGGEKVEFDGRSGYRLGAGTWLGCDRSNGIEGSYFQLERGSRFAPFFSNGDPFIGRPFIDNEGRENVFFSAISAALSGGFPLVGGTSVSTDSRVHGYEINLTRRMQGQGNLQVTGLAGFRSLTLK